MSTDFDKECRVVEMYIDSAKSYSQLSTGALALAAVFGPGQLPNLGGGLLLASACFLVAALAGGAYQSLAVGRLESLSGLPMDRKRPIPDSWYEKAYRSYNAMVVAFHIGAAALAGEAIIRLWGG